MRSTDEKIYYVNDLGEFQDLIESLDAALPSDRSHSDWKTLSEQYLVARVLNVLDGDDLVFPLEVVHADRPDFRLQMPGRKIGIELVEAASTNERKKNSMRPSDVSMWFIEPGVPGEEEKTAVILRDELENETRAQALGETLSEGSVGEPWPEWGRAMAYVIEKKISKASSPGFKRLSFNWLAIYDNWPMVMTVAQPDRMSEALLKELEVSGCFAVFDRIYIVSNRLVFDLSAAGVRISNELCRDPELTRFDRINTLLWNLYERLLLWWRS